MLRSKLAVPALSALTILAACGMARGQSFTANFESPTYNGSPAGTLLTGQNGWYVPVAGSADALVMTYAGSTPAIPPNPSGGGQCEAGIAGGNLLFARAQHPINFNVLGVWEASWDCLGFYNGTLPAVDNIGSFSLQPSATARYFQQLMSWGPTLATAGATDYTATADKFHIGFGFYNTTLPSGTTPNWGIVGPEWKDLPVNNWYHITVRWNFDTAQIIRASIKNLTTNGPETVTDLTSLQWYLQGGPGSTFPLPTDFRLFTGGGAGTSPPGNVAAWDNVKVAPVVTACYANCDGSTTAPILNVLDFICFQTKFAQNDPTANCDNSTNPPILNVLDFICFQTAYAQGCP
jgi:hypothetical protein